MGFLQMIAYKLFRKRKDGTLGPLFINRKQVIIPNIWLPAKAYRTKRFAFRPGWHCCSKPEAPHLKMEGRVWCLVEIQNFVGLLRPKAQGGMWYLAQRLKLIKELPYAHRYSQSEGL
jgi:hypothetical protein